MSKQIRRFRVFPAFAASATLPVNETLVMKLNVFVYTLTAAGIFSAAVAADTPATGNPAAAGDGVQVGVGKRDGITITGNEAYITRNGATEKLSKELVLPSGVIARPDGSMILPDKTEATLRASQLLTFEGTVVEVPRDPNVNPPAPAIAGASGKNSSGGASMNGAGMKGNNMNAGGGKMAGEQRNQNGGGGSVETNGGGTGLDAAAARTFVGADGQQFTGTIGADGSITTTDGRSIANDGTVRSVSFDQNGNPTFSSVSRNGTTTRADGSTVSADGTTRSADGTVISNGNGSFNANNTNGGANMNNNANGNSQNPNSPGTGGFQTPQGNNSGNTNSPNNAGTVNNGNSSGGNSANNTGTVNNPGSSTATQNGTNNGTQSNTTSGAAATNRSTGTQSNGSRNGGSTSGGGARSGASGAGGASGGGGGGASR